MKTMKKPKEKIKFSKLRLRASANKSKLSNSPRHPQEKISKYFSSVLTQNEDESQPSEDLISSDSQNTIKSNDLFKTSSSTSTLDDDDDGDDFVQSKVIKPAKIFDFKSTKEPKTSKQKHKKPESKFGRNINVPSCSDTNPEHMHMAIAMSKSLEDIENPDRDKTQDTEYGSTYASTQEKITRVKKTLDQFGFKSDKALSGLSSLISKKSNNLKKKYKYITPTLYLRTEEDRKIAIETKVSAIMTNISVYNDTNPHQFVVEDPEITIKKPHSFLLRPYFNCENTLFQKNGLEIDEMKPDLFYNGIVPQDSVPTGGLLRDWRKIPGREITPPPTDKKVKKSELSTSNDVISTSLSMRTAKKDDNSELLESDYISATLSNRNQIDFQSEHEKSPKNNVLNLESTSKVIISDLDKDTTSKESNSTSLNVFKTAHHGNVSPDLFSENEATDNDSPLRSNNNNLIIIPDTFSSNSKTPNNLIPNIQPLDISTNIDLPQIPISPERNIKTLPDSDASVSLLDTISPHRRKNKLLKRKRSGSSSSPKKNISLEFNDSKSLSLMDSISPKRKKILQPANTNRNSVVRKNIFDPTEDETIKPNGSQMLVTDSLKTSYALLKKAKNKIEHFESFTDDLDGIFHLSNSSSDTEQVTKSNGAEPKEISHTITKLLRECNRESDQSSRSEKDSFILRINTSESFKTNQITEYKVIETVDLTQNSEENEIEPTVETENDCLTVTQLLHECNTYAKIISKFLIKNTESFTSLVFPSINTSNNNQISVSSSSSEIENSFPSIDNEILPKKTTKTLENTLLLSSISSTDPEINSFPSIHNIITPKIGKTAIITSSDSETQIKNNQTSACSSSSENKTKNIMKLSNKTIKTKRSNKRASKTSSISSNEDSELELNSFPSINNDKTTKKLHVSSGENQINSFPSIENEKLPSKTKINEETSCTIISSAESETQINSLRFNDVKNKLISSSDDDTELHSELQQKLLNSTSVILNKTKQNLFPNNPSKITGISAKTSELNNKNNLIIDNNNSSSLSKLQIISLCSSDSENEHESKTLSNVNLNNITLNTSAIKSKITSKNSEKSVSSDSDKVETNLKVSKRKINLNKTYISSSENDSESNDSVKNDARKNIKTPEKNISSHLSNSKSLISSSDNEEINLSQIVRSKKYTKTKKYNKFNELVSTPKRSLTKTTSVDETNFNKPLSPTAFCYNKFYDEDINIISFLGHVNRKELTRSEDNLFQSPNNNKTLDRSTDMSIDKRKTRSFKRFFSESIIDDNKLNYTPRKSIEIPEKLKENNNSLSPSNENINLSQSLDDITISDEELNYSVRNQSKFVDDNMEFLSQSPIESNSDISDEELNYSSEKNRENQTESSFQLINHPKLKYLSTPKPTKNEVLKETNKVKEQTPKFCTPQPVITPNSDLIIKTSDVTPQANYSVMDTPARNQELAKFGLKPLKRAKGIKILQHIYDATHPVAGVVEEKVRKSLSSDEDDRIIKRRKQVSSPTETIQSNLNKSYPENIDIIGDQIANSEPLNEMLFERKQSARILSCPLPLHIAWHNFVSSHKNMQEKIILYEPLQVEEIYAEFKSCGFKYHIQDIITFLDRKCVTIRVAQNNHQGRKKKLAVSPKIK